MTQKRSKSELSLLDDYNIALTNVQKQPYIKEQMNLFGYTPERIAEGEALYANAMLTYNKNKTEDVETSEAYDKFEALKEEIDDAYRLDRKKSRIVFRKEPGKLLKLGINGEIPRAYLPWFETVETFYSVAGQNEQIQEALATLNTSPEHLREMGNKVAQLKTLRGDYHREVGESQEATIEKDKKFKILDEWMSEFYAVGRIALEDKPQLLEALGILVRS